MVITMAGQLKQLLFMACFGFAAAFVYDILRAMRRIYAQSTAAVSVQDILFWLLCAIGTLLAVFRVNYGEIRFFMFLGIFIGAAVYYAVVSPVFLKITAYAAGVIAAAADVLMYPFRLIINFMRPIFEYFVNFIKKYLKKLLICGKIITKRVCRIINVFFKKH